ncbi:MAG: hypothetical protein WKF71_05420 [Pyrinomonadaceae bacterium]
MKNCVKHLILLTCVLFFITSCVNAPQETANKTATKRGKYVDGQR